MATFQFRSQSVTLDFCGQVQFDVPLTDEVQKKVQDSAQTLLTIAKQAKASGDTTEDLRDLCDAVMDAVDDILGEGSADKIMAVKPDYTFWDACDVFKYVTDEIAAGFKARAVAYNPGGASASAPVPMNRQQRRAVARMQK